MITRLATSFLLLTPALLAQTTHLVQGGGDAFQTAVDAARPGDVLVVRAGSYDGASVHKGLTVRCDPGVRFLSAGLPPSFVALPPPGQTFAMRGGSIVSAAVLSSSLVTAGAGSSVFEGVAVGYNASLGGGQVAFHACTFSSFRIDGRQEPTRIAFGDCTASGTVEIESAEVTISGGTFTGTSSGFFSGPALDASNSRLTITGDPATRIAAGTGTPQSHPAIHADGGSVVVSPMVQLVAPGPAITGTARRSFRALPSVLAVPAGAGRPFSVAVHAEVGSSTHVLASLPRAPWSTPYGTLWIEVNSLLLDSGIVPPTGSRSTTIPLPTTLPPDVPLVLQSITTLVNGQLAFGPPTLLLLD